MDFANLFDSTQKYTQQEIRELANELKDEYPDSFVSFTENYSIKLGQKKARLRIIERGYTGGQSFPATLFEFHSVEGADIGEYKFKLAS